MLNRLQEQKSNYNVYNWETERKDTIDRIKSICYHKPSLLANKRTSKRSNRSTYNTISNAS